MTVESDLAALRREFVAYKDGVQGALSELGRSIEALERQLADLRKKAEPDK